MRVDVLWRYGFRGLVVAHGVPMAVFSFLHALLRGESLLVSGAFALMTAGTAAPPCAYFMHRLLRTVRLAVPLDAEARSRSKRSWAASSLSMLGYRLEMRSDGQFILKEPGSRNGFVAIEESDGVVVVTGPALSARLALILVPSYFDSSGARQ
jgi:hypothetical protein